MKTLIIASLCSFVLTVISGKFLLPLLKKLKAGQPILNYVTTHKEKNGTPTMGGLFFILSASAVFLLFGGYKWRMSLVALSIGLAFLIVGFIDDFIKVKFKRNEGLKVYQKVVFQLTIALFAGVYCFRNGITFFHLPFTKKGVDLGWITIPFVTIIFIAITNSVNLTDGLDGLAGATSITYLSIICVLISIQCATLKQIYLLPEEYESLMLLAFCLIGAIAGFLIFNVNKASVFMGDTGSLSLGGFIGAISIFSSNSIFIPLIGIMFALSSISVILQVIYYKRTKMRIFLMSPIHHHFQLKGYSETQISYLYSLITMIFGAISLLSYM